MPGACSLCIFPLLFLYLGYMVFHARVKADFLRRRFQFLGVVHQMDDIKEEGCVMCSGTDALIRRDADRENTAHYCRSYRCDAGDDAGRWNRCW